MGGGKGGRWKALCEIGSSGTCMRVRKGMLNAKILVGMVILEWNITCYF